MIYILLILSFLLESVFTKIVNINSFLIPLFVITSLTILYPYFKNKINFIITCVVCGFFYDISFSDSLFINTISFGICGGVLILVYNYIKYNIYTSNFLNILNIMLYRLVSYLLLVIVDVISFNGFRLFEGIYNSIILNIIYGVIIYLISNLISKIFNIKRD